MPNKVWDEIMFPFPNSNGGTFDLIFILLKTLTKQYDLVDK